MVAGSAVQNLVQDLDHQQLLMAASDMLEIYMAESTILRTESKDQGEDKVQEQIAMAKYTYQAVDIVTQKEKKVFSLLEVMNNE
jgi:hypothetical protein